MMLKSDVSIVHVLVFVITPICTFVIVTSISLKAQGVVTCVVSTPLRVF